MKNTIGSLPSAVCFQDFSAACPLYAMKPGPSAESLGHVDQLSVDLGSVIIKSNHFFRIRDDPCIEHNPA